jgi:MoaA/NifB/PqqE/SkfB family radical SAM enzyme
MAAEIIKVTPTEKYFSITWRITTRCNYDCMYCPTKWHDSTGVLHDLTTLQSAWQSILSRTEHLNLPYKLSFSGGEVTTNKNFLPFVKWLRQQHGSNIFSILLTTNGSASFNYYKKLFDSVDNVSFSFHSEHANEQRFFDTVVNLKNVIDRHKFLHVNIMDEHWNQNRIPHYVQILSDNDISYSINHVDYSLQTRTIPIFKGQLNLNV